MADSSPFVGAGARRRLAPALVVPGLVIIGFVALYPLVLALLDSITQRDNGQSPYAWVFDNPVYLKIIWRTIVTALIVAGMCVLVGYPLAYVMATTRSARARSVLLLLVVLPFWTSFLVRVFAWLILFQPDGIVESVLQPFGFDGAILGSVWAPRIAMVQLLLPFMVLPMYATMRGIDPSLLRAAESLGASPREAFARIFLPLSLPGVGAGCLIVFIMSLGFYVAPALLGSPTTSLVGQAVFQQVGTLLNFGRGAALAAFLLAITLMVLGIAALMRRLLGSRTSDA
ncbi:ABC transporter permease [Aeromicrobium panaciterrae]|uniref:ABC transporter permease n=1 Tax=Aeromicrobium panaciterrae TaxID=363861 RepID=UPI0031DFCE3D